MGAGLQLPMIDADIRAQMAAAVGEILARAEADIAARKPVCQASGRCCRFEEYGHRLYVTGAELVYFAEKQEAPHELTTKARKHEETRQEAEGFPPSTTADEGVGTTSPPSTPSLTLGALLAREGGTPNGRVVSLRQFFAAEKQKGCPYQMEGLCTAREGRPLGCRIYFCDAAAQGWQNEVYEQYHAQLQALHERFGLPYVYVEWRAGLRMLLAGEI